MKTTKPRSNTKPPIKKAKQPITELEMTFCHLCMSGDGGKGMSQEKAAEKLGLPAKDGRVIAQRLQVKAYFEEYRRTFMMEMARQEATQVHKFDVTRANAVALLWKLANTAPERTRGSINGQVDAVDKIGEMLGFKVNPRDFNDALVSLTEEQLLHVAEHGKLPAQSTIQ